MRWVRCHVISRWRSWSASGESLTSQKSPDSELSVCRNQAGHICLQVTARGREQLFKVSELRVHAKFIKQGKATLTFISDGATRRLMIKNAPPGDLEKTVRLLMIKHHVAAPVKRVLSGDVDEISPLRPAEMNKINQKLNQHHQVVPKTPTKNNTTPVRKLKRRRLQAEKAGLLAPRIKKIDHWWKMNKSF